MKLHTLKLVAVAAILIFSSCKKEETAEIAGKGTINLEFDHLVGTQALQLNTGNYINANGDDFKVTTFKYYISNIVLIRSDGTKTTLPETYLLVNAANAASRLQKLEDVPAGDYTSIEFTIGVDEARNFAGAQTGALDPANGMFWSWNTGYIFLMFEGTSSKSTQPSNQLFFHVGGAKAPTNAIRKTLINFPSALRVRTDSAPDVHFFVDISTLFKGSTTINFATLSAFHGGVNALLVADNYVNGLFKIDHIHN